MGTQILYIGEEKALSALLSNRKCIVLVDSKTNGFCLHKAKTILPFLQTCAVIAIPADEANKNLATLEWIWKNLITLQADKNTILITHGGGMVSDIGGLAAATYMRGIDCIHIPTTLLAMTDAAIGGKTAINFEHSAGNITKNILGQIHLPIAVYVNPIFLETLSDRLLKEGTVESIKHYLIADKEQWKKIETIIDFRELTTLESITKSIRIKEKIVAQDIDDKGIRQALNFGHSIGHAVEASSQATAHPCLHGEAVLYGMLVELAISEITINSNTQIRKSLFTYNQEQLKIALPNPTLEELLPYLQLDKKNSGGQLVMTLIADIAEPKLKMNISLEIIRKAMQLVATTT
jgi:3-dehydroquinate synthase